TELLHVEDAMQPVPESVALSDAPRVYPDLPLDAVLRLLSHYPLLPVATRNDPNHFIGVISLEDVHRAYGIDVNNS
ncbi:MAG TPA: CBS domain-containing protein, partial [Bryobacteraceae bacterium]|nr:CBS domain-containing protein [Bryobacteraceae bacterium]